MRIPSRRVLVWAALAVAVLGVFALIFLALPALFVHQGDAATAAQRLKLRNDIRSAGAQFVGALVLAAGLVFTAKTLQVNREGQITDRFTKAIEQLGSDKLDVRLGGIYSLERLARDSRRDHGPVMEVLSAYVRRYQRVGSEANADQAPYDVQAAVSVLGRRDTAYEEEGYNLDLSTADLRFVRIDRANLRNAFLQAVDLSGAHVTASDLRNVILQDAKAGAVFGETDLSEALLWGADLSDAMFLLETRLEGAEYDQFTVWPPHMDPRSWGATDKMASDLQQSE